MTKHRSVMVGQREGRCDVNMPTPGMIGYPGPDLDQTPDQPFHRTPDLLVMEVNNPDYVQKVVCKNAHLQTGVVGLEAVASGLVPAESVLDFLIFMLNTS